MIGPYESRFQRGAKVRVVDESRLRAFAREWHFHHPLTAEQLAYADSVAIVKDVGFYHGGDPLYELADIPGLWHDACLTEP